MKKILLISTNALGDTYISASVINLLRQHLDGCEIHFITNSVSSLFLTYLPVDKIFYLKKKTVIQILLLLLLIRKNKYDFTFLFFPGWVNSIFYFCIKSKIKAGFPNLKYISRWDNKTAKVHTNLSDSKKISWFPNMNYLERIGLVLQSVGMNKNKLSKPVFNNLQIYNLPYKDFILIHYQSRIKEKSLSEPAIIEIAKYFHTFQIIILTNTIKNNMSNFTSDIKFIINPSISQLITFIIKAKLFIAVDSFPIHIADAYNSNFVGIFGPTNPHSVLVNYQKAIYFPVKSLEKLELELIIKKLKNYIVS